jgi:hypothetical protein
MLKTNTAKHCVRSLFRQGCMLYNLTPTVREQSLGPFDAALQHHADQQPLFADIFRPV